jgi:predicted GNAT family acetyltransferase
MDIAVDDLNVEHKADARRFEIRYGDELAWLEYRRLGSSIIYTHTIVPPPLEGHGIAGRLAREALDYARKNALAVVPLCPYVADYIDKHPAYSDLVAPEAKGG